MNKQKRHKLGQTKNKKKSDRTKQFSRGYENDDSDVELRSEEQQEAEGCVTCRSVNTFVIT